VNIKIRKIRNIRRSRKWSHDRIPLLGLSSSKVGLHGIWQWSWFVQILLMELVNHFTLGMKFSRFPLQYIVTNPFDQILEFAAIYLGVQDCFDKVLILAINLNWWWWVGPLT
jgi:hypothetical protein